MSCTSQGTRITRTVTWLILLAALVSFSSGLPSLSPSVATAAPPAPATPPDRSHIISAADAQQYAQQQITSEAGLGAIPAWQGASAGAAIAHYDLAGAISAYVIAVMDQADRMIGYVVVSAPVETNPIREFAEGAPPYLAGLAHARSVAAQEGGTLVETHPLYLGPLSYFYELTTSPLSSTRRIINAETGDIRSIDPGQIPFAIAQQVRSAPPAASMATAQSLQAIKQLDSVPDYKQFRTTYAGTSCKSGCTPTATASVMAYWANKGYPNVFDGNAENLIKDLGVRMGASCGTWGVAWSSIGNVAAAVQGLAAAKGYTFNSSLLYPAEVTFGTYQSSIDDGYPAVVHLIYQSNSSLNHSVAGMGYQTDANGNYMIVRDNLAPAGTRYVNFTVADQSVYLNTVRPVATIAVGQNSSRQDVFQRAYETSKSGTVYNLPYSTPTSGTYWYNGIVRQDFSGGISLIHDEGADNPIRSVPVYPIFGAIRTYWERNLWLGAPTSHAVTNVNGDVEQHFRSGWVKHSNAQQREWSEQWPTEASCTSQGKWRLEFIKLYQAAQGVGPGMTWPPKQSSTSGPSMVICVSPQRSGYAMFYDVGSRSPYNLSNYEYMLWSDYWITRMSGKISGLPSSLVYRVSAACDDGCDMQIKSATFSWWTQRITSWRDQPASNLGSAWVQNGDQVNITWYERTGLARVWLKLGSSALTMPPLAAQCDARIKIADGAPVINTLATTLTISATDALDMKVGRLEDLSDASWQPYTTTLPLQFTPSSSVITQTVYAQFRDSTGATLCQGAIMADDILLDPLPPIGTATIMANDALTVTFHLDASDQADGSGIDSVAVWPIDPAFPVTTTNTLPENIWQPYDTTVITFKPMISDAGVHIAYQVWFRDAAGNIAAPLTVIVPYIAAQQRVYLPLISR
ncbi:MAG: C39 family peptidase [Chloroflexales bacterium]